MKKIIIWIVFSSLVFGIAKNNKFNLLTNFNNFKKYTINIDINKYRNKKSFSGFNEVKSSMTTNGIFTYSVEAIFFKDNEGVLDELTKSQIYGLPESPQKYFQLSKYAYKNAIDFDKDMSFLFSSTDGIKDRVKKRVKQYGKDYYRFLRTLKDFKVISAIKVNENSMLVFYDKQYIHKGNPWTKYNAMVTITKENGKWVEISGNNLFTMGLREIHDFLVNSYIEQKKGKSSKSGSSDENSTFFDAFEEVEE